MNGLGEGDEGPEEQEQFGNHPVEPVVRRPGPAEADGEEGHGEDRVRHLRRSGKEVTETEGQQRARPGIE